MPSLEDPRKPVLIQWIDAHRGANEWTFLNADYKPPQNMDIWSAGYIVSVNDRSVTIAGHVGPGDDDEPSQFCGEITIPKVAVKGIWHLTAGKKKPLKKA